MVKKRKNTKDFKNIFQTVSSKNPIGLKPNNAKVCGWYVLANLSVIMSLLVTIVVFRILVGDSSEEIKSGIISFIQSYKFILFMVCSCSVYSVWKLIKSKEIVKKIYKIRTINSNNQQDELDKQLYTIVSEISKKANLPNTPEVGIYESDDMNAFATGLNRKESLIAFSSALIENMDASQISAVAAHEIAHIANGDMVGMTIIQSSVMAFSIIVQIPLTMINFFYHSVSDSDGKSISDWVITGLITIFQVITFKVTMFWGNLLALYYSRKREFLADAIAAKITTNTSMREALVVLQNFTHPEQTTDETQLAMFKISANDAMVKLLSSHPPLSERIQRLNDVS